MTVKTISHAEVFNLHFFLDLLCCTLQNKVQHFTSQVLNLKQIKNPSETCMLLFNTSNDSRNQEQRKYTFESSLRLVSIYRSVNTWQRSSYNTDSSVKRLLVFLFCFTGRSSQTRDVQLNEMSCQSKHRRLCWCWIFNTYIIWSGLLY